MNEDKIKKDIEEIETINIELDHRVSKLIAENEHLKQTYKQLYDSIKPTHLNAQLQEKVFAITALKEELRKLNGKSVITCRESVNKPKVISLVVRKEDLEPLSLKLKNNREAHIQELLVYVSDTCPSSPSKSEKLVSVIPMNKARKVTFAKTSTTSYNNTQIQVDIHQTQTTNKPLVHSTNEKCSTNASRSKPQSETKSNKIMQPLSSNQKYQKVEAHIRNAKPSLTKEDMNDRARAKAVKSIKMKERKPTGLVLNPPPSTPCVPPSRTDWDLLIQLLFDELLTPPPSVDHPAPEVIALIAEVVAPKPASSTTVDQDAPSPNIAHMNNDPFFGISILENDSEASSLDVIPTVMHTATPNSEHINKWTKDHPLDNIIDELERPVSIRLQLHEQALFCYYDAFLTSVEPKNYKDALTQACWIKAMQEELHKFDRLKVWELVLRPI
ncbi:hypothetical protein Tco_0196726 [Tanacetum coccineum]